MSIKILIPLGTLLLAIIACSKFQSQPAANLNAEKTPTPTPVIVKIADFPALFGKSVGDVKAAMGGAKIDYESKDSIDYVFPQGTISIDTRASVRNEMLFHLYDNTEGKLLTIYAKTPQEVANFVGIDLTGKTPSSSSDYNITYEDKFNGKPVEITFIRKDSGQDKFDSVMVMGKGK